MPLQLNVSCTEYPDYARDLRNLQNLRQYQVGLGRVGLAFCLLGP